MTTFAMLSHHTSNPLEVPTSDVQNARAHQHYQANQLGGVDPSSDDPLNSYIVEDREDYLHHIHNLFPEMTPVPAQRLDASTSASAVQPQRLFEVLGPVTTEDSDDELEIIPRTHAEVDKGVGVEVEDDKDDLESKQMPPLPEKEPVEFSPELGITELPENDDDAMPECVEDEEMYETDEENTIQFKDAAEREEIEDEIAELEEAVPALMEDYKIVDRLGTGTFSSVYKAVDRHYWTKWHNGAWKGKHPSDSSAYYQTVEPRPNSKVFVAIKRIYVTSNPERIRNEITILEDCRGCRHVSQLITAFRHKDQVVVIMPYQRNDDFRDIYKTLSMAGIKAYFRSLLRALRDIHSRGIIHRDVKPANFLFDARTGTGTLCDFGLACRVDLNAKHSHCLHTPASLSHPHGRKKANVLIDINVVKASQREARQKNSLPSERVGYPEKETRQHSKANRAGTRGFRAPEVLLKCNDQTGAVDIWSAGMIFLFFFTGKFPLFQSNDDIEALMELASLLGRKRMEAAATLHNRTFATNVPSVTREGMTWTDFIKKNNPNIYKPSRPLNTSTPHDPNSVCPEYSQDLKKAFELIEKMLRPESIDRITARDALYDPFLAEEAPPDPPYSSSSSAASISLQTPTTPEWGDDRFFPHPLGHGKCGKYHFIDEKTEEQAVRIPNADGTGHTIRLIQAGEGIAIGQRPCEFHEHLDEYKD